MLILGKTDKSGYYCTKFLSRRNYGVIAGNKAEYDGITATKVVDYDEEVSFEEGVEVVLDWLSEDKLDLVCMYTDEPDKAGHE